MDFETRDDFFRFTLESINVQARKARADKPEEVTAALIEIDRLATEALRTLPEPQQ
jgi:hypothetical protein